MSESLCIECSDVNLPAESPLTRYLSHVLPHLPDMMAVHGADGTYRLVSPQIRQITGRRPSDVIGRSPYEWVHPEDLAMVKRRYHDGVLTGAAIHGRYRMRHEAGYYIWLEFVAVPMFQDPKAPKEVTTIVTLGKDVTPLVEAEQSAADRLRHLGLMEELGGLAWFTVSHDNRALQHNEAFVELTGRAGSAFTDRKDWKSLVYPDDLRRLRAAVLNLWRKPVGETATLELRLVPASKLPRWVRLTLSMVDTPDGRHRQWFGVLLDIDELIRSREQTQRWIRQRERVSSRERQDIAHELHDEVGQILTGLRWQLEALQRRVQSGEGLPAPEALPLGQWLSSIDEAHSTLRLIAHRLRPPLAAIGLRAAIQKLADEFSSLWLGSTALKLHLDAELPDGDEWQVTTVLGILRESLNNVARHAKATEVRVEARQPAQGWLKLTVVDDGVGMHVPTAQAGDTLGLTSLQERARWIDARFSLDSTPGHGTRMTLSVWMNAVPVHD